MEILVGDVISRAVTADASALASIRSICRARPDGYQYMKRYKKGHWDGYISLMTSFNSFPTGLLGMVVECLKGLGYDISIDWGDSGYRRLNSVQEDSIQVKGNNLFDYQVEAVHKGINATRGIFKMATGAGKTAVMAAILYGLNLLEEETAVVIVSGVDLLYQVSEEISNMLSVPVGLIGDGNKKFEQVTVAVIDSLARYGEELQELFPNNAAVLIDECHHGSSDTYLKALYNLPGHYRFGFSGTPLNRSVLMDMRLIGLTGRVIYERTNEDQIEAGYSARPFIQLHTVYSDENGDWKLDYNEAYNKLIVNNTERNSLIGQLAKKATGVVLIIVTRIVHGLELQKLIEGSIFVNGSDSSDYRKFVLQQMREEDGVYISTNIFDEGVDVPAIGTLIYAPGGKSERAVLQRLGRGLRKKDGDNVLIVHDFIDDTNRYLLRHSEERIDVYINEGFEVEEV